MLSCLLNPDDKSAMQKWSLALLWVHVGVLAEIQKKGLLKAEKHQKGDGQQKLPNIQV